MNVYNRYGNATYRETGNAVNSDLVSEFYSAPDAASVLRQDAAHRKWKSRKKSEAARQASLESKREAGAAVQELYPEDAEAAFRGPADNGAGCRADDGSPGYPRAQARVETWGYGQPPVSTQARAYGNGQAYMSFLTPEQRMEREASDAEAAGNLYEGGGQAAGARYAGHAPQDAEQAGHAHRVERTAERPETGDAARAQGGESFGDAVRRLRTELTETYRRARREKDEAERHTEALRMELNSAVATEEEISRVLGEYGEQIKKAAKAEGWGRG